MLSSRIISILRTYLKESNLSEDEIEVLRCFAMIEGVTLELLEWLDITPHIWSTLSLIQKRTIIANFGKGRQ